MDIIDVAQRRQQEAIDQALAARKPAAAGRTTCANLTCGEPITPVRRQMGAQLCLDCQQRLEREAQRWAHGGI